MVDKPNPGSEEALKQGCICAVLDNRHGLGAIDNKDGVFWVTEGCPLHDDRKGITEGVRE